MANFTTGRDRERESESEKVSESAKERIYSVWMESRVRNRKKKKPLLMYIF